MKRNIINLETIATADNFGVINTLVDHFGIIQRFETIDDEISTKQNALDRLSITINELDKKYEKAFGDSLSAFSSTAWTEEDSKKLSKAHDRKQSLKKSIQALKDLKTELLIEISAWTDRNGNGFVNTDVALTYYTDLIKSLHFVDKRTIEILSALMYNVNLTMPNEVKSALDRYYTFKVSHAFSVNGDKENKELKDLEKLVRQAVQKFVNAYSIIYNEERTSEGLFVPQHLNVNATEVSIFIATYFKGTKIDETGFTSGTYANEKSMISELNKLMLCKFQGMKYGQRYEVKKDKTSGVITRTEK